MRLAFMRNAPNSADMTQSAFEARITTQCALCVTLITACIPCLKPFLDAFDSGMLGIGLRKRNGGSHSDSYNNSCDGGYEPWSKGGHNAFAILGR